MVACQPRANLLIGPVMTTTFPATYVLALVGIISPATASWVGWIPATGLDITISLTGRLAPLMPLMQLPVHGPSMAVVVAVQCFAALALVSRDGGRWITIFGRRLSAQALPAKIIVSGALVGGMAAVLLGTLVR